MVFALPGLMSYILRVFICLAGLSWAVGAQAGVSRTGFIDYDFNLKENEAFFADPLKEDAADIDRMTGIDVAVDVLVMPASNNAAFDYGSIVTVPRTLEMTNHWGVPYPKTIMDIQAVFAHEYGHAVFSKLLVPEFPEYARLAAKKSEISALTLRAVYETADKEGKKSLAAEINAKEKQIEADRALTEVAWVVSPYSELFADAVAVYHSSSPTVIFNALYSPGLHAGALEDLKARDFSLPHDAANWSITTPHGMFAPLRTLLGSEACWPRDVAEKTLRLRQLSTVLLAQIHEKMRTRARPAPADNQALINAFSVYCQQGQ